MIHVNITINSHFIQLLVMHEKKIIVQLRSFLLKSEICNNWPNGFVAMKSEKNVCEILLFVWLSHIKNLLKPCCYSLSQLHCLFLYFRSASLSVSTLGIHCAGQSDSLSPGRVSTERRASTNSIFLSPGQSMQR